MTITTKHATRRQLQTANATVEQARARNNVLRERFPPRSAEAWWPATAQSADEVLRRLTAPPFLAAANVTRAGRRRGVAKLLRWLSSLPGDTWQQRWKASRAEEIPGADWTDLPLRFLRQSGPSPSYERADLTSGLLMLVCGDVIRADLAWMLTRTHKHLAPVMAEVRDPEGFARLAQLAESGPVSARGEATIAATRIAMLLACKGGPIADITVGDCVELVDTLRRVHVRGGQRKVDFYLRLRALGVFPEDAPATIRAFGLAAGRLSIEELVDRYPIRCRPVRDLIVDYLRERQPSLDYTSLDAVSRTLAGLFWTRIEALSPGIDSLRLPPALARAWKTDIATKKRTTIGPDGTPVEVASPRLNAKDELIRVRAFYLDIAHWAAEEPVLWAPWAVACPISDEEISKAKDRKHRKARMDQRTRERLPVLPVLNGPTNFRRYGDRPRHATHSPSSVYPGGGNGFAGTITGWPAMTSGSTAGSVATAARS
ncbi:hypothetical protein ABZ776_28155 [Streptomyces sp. NPDC007076]|uniref:hypothetical protein n=1 Tax=unclassified Streptomyces TaxID=2593676 RepID=UPI0034054E81